MQVHTLLVKEDAHCFRPMWKCVKQHPDSQESYNTNEMRSCIEVNMTEVVIKIFQRSVKWVNCIIIQLLISYSVM